MELTCATMGRAHVAFAAVFAVSQGFTYDEPTTIRELELTEASYCLDSVNDRAAYKMPSGAIVTHVTEQVSSGGRALVGYDDFDNTIFVAYRGSSNLRNWIENAKFIKTKPYSAFPDVETEQGFLDWYKDLNKAGLLAAVEEAGATYGTNKLKITGHSAGAACATLLATDVGMGTVLTTFALQKATTFGSPRVGNAHFAALYQRLGVPTTRVTHYHDLVPHIPMERTMHFQHVPNEVYYDEDNANYKVCDGSGEDPTCSNACAPTHCTSTQDHLFYLNVTLGVAGCQQFSAAGLEDSAILTHRQQPFAIE